VPLRGQELHKEMGQVVEAAMPVANAFTRKRWGVLLPVVVSPLLYLPGSLDRGPLINMAKFLMKVLTSLDRDPKLSQWN
jgi:hypothetical protein